MKTSREYPAIREMSNIQYQRLTFSPNEDVVIEDRRNEKKRSNEIRREIRKKKTREKKE